MSYNLPDLSVSKKTLPQNVRYITDNILEKQKPGKTENLWGKRKGGLIFLRIGGWTGGLQVRYWAHKMVLTHHLFCSSSGGDRAWQWVKTGTSLCICAWHPVRRAPDLAASLQHWKIGTTNASPPLTHCRGYWKHFPVSLTSLLWRVAQDIWVRLLVRNALEDPISLCWLQRESFEMKVLILLNKISHLKLGNVKSLSFPQGTSLEQSRQIFKVLKNVFW